MFNRDELLQDIYSLDPKIFARADNASENVLYEIRSSLLEKHNDKFPTTLQLVKTGGIQGGCAEVFKKNYTATDTGDEPNGVINIGMGKIMADIEVIKVLRALLHTGMGYDETLARTCHNMVMSILQSQNDGYITKNQMLGALSCADYYSESLTTAIKEILS